MRFGDFLTVLFCIWQNNEAKKNLKQTICVSTGGDQGPMIYEPHYEKIGFLHIENKEADQLRSNRDQRLCFRYTDSTIPLLPKSEISSLSPSSVTVQPGLCRTWSETLKTGFLTTRLICTI